MSAQTSRGGLRSLTGVQDSSAAPLHLTTNSALGEDELWHGSTDRPTVDKSPPTTHDCIASSDSR